MEKEIKQLQNQLLETSDDDFAFIGERLKIIREELKKENKLFQKLNVVQITGIPSNTLYRIEKGVTSSYKDIFKLINLYKIKGYNPLWITTKNNIFIPKKEESNSDIIYNKASVSKASSKLVEDINELQEGLNKALKQYKKAMNI